MNEINKDRVSDEEKENMNKKGASIAMLVSIILSVIFVVIAISYSLIKGAFFMEKGEPAKIIANDISTAIDLLYSIPEEGEINYTLNDFCRLESYDVEEKMNVINEP